MILTEAIVYLRGACPIFAKRVAGTQSFALATDEDADIDLPCAFVVPMSKSGDAATGNEVAQKMTERFAVIVCLDNSVKVKAEGNGTSQAENLTTAEQQLFNAFLGWTPETRPNADTIRFRHAQFLHMNKARFWYQFEFYTSYYQGPTGDNTNAQLEALINGYFPEVDPNKVREILAGFAPAIGPDNLAAYEVAWTINEDVSPAWIKHTGLSDPATVGQQIFGEGRDLQKPVG